MRWALKRVEFEQRSTATRNESSGRAMQSRRRNERLGRYKATEITREDARGAGLGWADVLSMMRERLGWISEARATKREWTGPATRR